MCYEGKFVGNYMNGNKESTQYGWMDKVYISSPFYPNNTASIKLMDGTCIGLNYNSEKSPKALFIDINGSYRRPNVAGYDLFFFQVVENTIRPYGYDWKTEDLFNASKGNSCHPKANPPVEAPASRQILFSTFTSKVSSAFCSLKPPRET